MNKNKIVVRLMGRDYTLLTDQSPEAAQRTARYVDRKMREVAITTRAGDAMVSALTALTLADELFQAQDENTRLKQELSSRLQEEGKA